MNTGLGFALGIVSGLMAGSFSVPMKKTTRWAWENTWLVWAIVALLIVPWGMVALTCPNAFAIYSEVGFGSLAMVFLFGLGWGLGAVTFGQSIAIIGMSLSFAICIGLTIVVGSIAPMMATLEIFTTPKGATVTAGIAVLVVAIIVCAVAGGRKDAQLKADVGGKASTVSAGLYIKGLILAVLGGLFSSMINVAFNFSGGIKEAAGRLHATPGGASDAIWAIVTLGGLAANVFYCSLLLTRNRTWQRYREAGSGSHWLLAALMGAIWMFSVTLYGRAAPMMGSLGGSAGWAVYMGACIAASNVWGIATGEWKDGKGRPINTMYAGLALLLIAIAIVGYGNSLS